MQRRCSGQMKVTKGEKSRGGRVPFPIAEEAEPTHLLNGSIDTSRVLRAVIESGHCAAESGHKSARPGWEGEIYGAA